MTFDPKNIIIDHDAHRFGTEEVSGYVTHVLCLQGQYDFTFNGEPMTLRSGELMIVPSAEFVDPGQGSCDFRCTVIYVVQEFLRTCTPKNNYDVFGVLSLFNNPIIPLEPAQLQQCCRDYADVEERLSQTHHHFQQDIMESVTRMLFLDFYEFHASHYGMRDISLQNSELMNRFIALLEEGHYMQRRDIGFYADKLCVTAKYLSEVCKQTSGMAANYWINRFTALHIRRLLLEKKLSLTEISDMLEFSSPAYFTRFVRNNLGMPPSAFRE